MTFIEPPRLELLPHPFFIVTEGMGDARLIDEILQFRGITNCSVGCPSRESSKNKTGKDAFPDYLASIQTARTRVNSVTLRGILVIGDADTDADVAFGAIRDALNDAIFPTPDRSFSIQEIATFRVAVYLLPGQGRTGTLEHLLLEAALLKKPELEKCLDDFSDCTGALRSAKQNKQAKMRMSVLAGAFCEDNPWCSAHTMWSDVKNPVPIDTTCFDHLSAFITDFRS